MIDYHKHDWQKVDAKAMKEVFGRHVRESSSWKVCRKCAEVQEDIRMSAYDILSREQKKKIT